MEIVCTLSKIENLRRLADAGVDGIIFGSAFSLRFSYSEEELKKINYFCLKTGLKRYISIDAFVFENDNPAIHDYFSLIKELNPDGIYFTDLGIINIAKSYGLEKLLIYDPDTLMTNSADASFYLKQNIGVVLARELSFKELFEILKNNPKKCDVQVFGHLKMSNSKRKFLSNYFKYIDKDVEVEGKRSLRIVEETRNYSLPIIEDKYGTRIYTDYILMMYRELAQIKELINRAIVDDTFIELELVCDVIKDIRKVTRENAEFLMSVLKNIYKNESFSNGYLDMKTSKTKDENE